MPQSLVCWSEEWWERYQNEFTLPKKFFFWVYASPQVEWWFPSTTVSNEIKEINIRFTAMLPKSNNMVHIRFSHLVTSFITKLHTPWFIRKSKYNLDSLLNTFITRQFKLYQLKYTRTCSTKSIYITDVFFLCLILLTWHWKPKI